MLEDESTKKRTSAPGKLSGNSGSKKINLENLSTPVGGLMVSALDS